VTVAAYGEQWLAGRQERGVRAIVGDRGRLTNQAFPHRGVLLLREVKPRHVRDMVRALRQAGELAPRTILNVYGLVHTMFRDALVDELIEGNPCMLHRGELPEKTDEDPEWRASATCTAREVEQLISDSRIPVEPSTLVRIDPGLLARNDPPIDCSRGARSVGRSLRP
jgi:hypothetical protein